MSRPVFGSDAAAQLVYTPALSVAQVSICDTRLRAFDFASESWPFFCWPRKAGRAIAARMPMIRITTRSSIRVKPFSSLLIRWESFRSIGHSSLEPVVWPDTSALAPRWRLGRLRRDEHPRSPGALRPRLATGLPLHRVLTLFSPDIDRSRDFLIPGVQASTPAPEMRRGRAAMARPPREN